MVSVEANRTVCTVLSQIRAFSVFCDLNDWTSHLLAVCNFSAHCVGAEKLKGKGFPNKS